MELLLTIAIGWLALIFPFSLLIYVIAHILPGEGTVSYLRCLVYAVLWPIVIPILIALFAGAYAADCYIYLTRK